MEQTRAALVVGATGMVGALVVKELLKSDKYERVRVLVRKPLDIQHPKLEVIIFDFDNPNPSLVVGDDVFCCLGTTMKAAGSKPAFYKVDYTYPYQIATLAISNHAKRFAIISAMGANAKSMIYYNRVKGEIEEALRSLKFEALLIFRPSLLLGKRTDGRVGEIIGEKLSSIFKPLIPIKYQAIEVSKVADAMVLITSSNVKGQLIYESDVLQEF